MTDWPEEYVHFPQLAAVSERFLLRPIQWSDREKIRDWRNAQIDVLRQAQELTVADQDRYFKDVIRPQMSMATPPQILWGLLEDDTLIGYGGLVHIQWADSRAEVSFLTDTQRLNSPMFEADWAVYLSLIVEIATSSLGIHKLTTETYGIRPDVLAILESFGFQQEGVHPEHHRINERWVTSFSHGLVLNSQVQDSADTR